MSHPDPSYDSYEEHNQNYTEGGMFKPRKSFMKKMEKAGKSYKFAGKNAKSRKEHVHAKVAAIKGAMERAKK